MGVPAITIARQPLKRVLSPLYKEETRVKTKQTLMAALVAVASATSAQAQCLTDAQAADLVANYVAKTPAANPENLTDADGACTRGKVNALLAQRMGIELPPAAVPYNTSAKVDAKFAALVKDL